MSSYDFWRRALKDEKQPVHENEAHAGFWYMRTKGNGRIPVATYEHSGALVALVGFESNARTDDPLRIWTWICQHPITEEVYRVAYETGQWPDDPPAPFAPTSDGEERPNEAADPFGALRSELVGEAELANKFLGRPVDSKEAANKTAVWARRIGDLAKRADEHRKVEKEPHLTASRAIDAKWSEIIDLAKDLSSRLKRHLEPWLKAEARAEAERKRAEEEKARKLREEAAKANDPDTVEALTAQADATEREATEKKNTAAGRTGAKVALRSEKYAKITDYEALLLALKDDADVRELVEKIANRAARASVKLPGMEIETRQRAA